MEILELTKEDVLNTPLVSILMTAYNRVQYIGEAIESVLNSTYKNYELIIVDDCSVDGTIGLIQQYAKENQKIRVYLNNRNLGDYPNRNQAARYAKGRYLMYVDSDDLIEPDAIAYVIKNLLEFPSARFSTIYHHNDISSPKFLSSNESVGKHFFGNNFLIVGPGGTVIERDFFFSINCFPTLYGPANDLYYNLKAASCANILLLPYCYLKYRRHAGQEINRGDLYLRNHYRMINDVLRSNWLPIDNQQKDKLRKRYANEFIVHSLVYLKNSFNLRNFFSAYLVSGITFKIFFKALFYRNKIG